MNNLRIFCCYEEIKILFLKRTFNFWNPDFFENSIFTCSKPFSEYSLSQISFSIYLLLFIIIIYFNHLIYFFNLLNESKWKYLMNCGDVIAPKSAFVDHRTLMKLMKNKKLPCTAFIHRNLEILARWNIVFLLAN